MLKMKIEKAHNPRIQKFYISAENGEQTASILNQAYSTARSFAENVFDKSFETLELNISITIPISPEADKDTLCISGNVYPGESQSSCDDDALQLVIYEE